MQGDCLELLSLVPDKSVDMICADLPYGTTQCKWDTIIALHAQTPFDKVLGASNLRLLKYEWIWEKTAATGHLNAKKAPMKAHENILIFYKKLPKYHPQKTTGHSPVHSYTKHTDDGDCYGATQVGISGGGSTERYPRSVVVFSPDKQKCALHPTQKPIGLIEYLLRTYTDEGDLVLDNCMGSGTTGVACKRLGRGFIGMELDENYFEIAKRRIEEEQNAYRIHRSNR